MRMMESIWCRRRLQRALRRPVWTPEVHLGRLFGGGTGSASASAQLGTRAEPALQSSSKVAACSVAASASISKIQDLTLNNLGRTRVGLSAVMWVSLVFQAILGAANIVEIKGHKLIRKAQPEAWQDWIVLGLSLLAAWLTFARKPLFPSTASVLAVTAFMLTFALLPPLVGVFENRFRAHGDRVFALSRFRGHIITNFFGAAAVAAFFWMGSSTPGFTKFTQQFSDASAFNVVLPLATVVIFAFVRQQQVAQCPNLNQLVHDKKEKPEELADGLRGYSLADTHQLLNCLYLIAALFMGASTILYLLAFTIVQARNDTPVAFSPQMAIAMVALLGFLFACGTPMSWGNRTVYFSFLTGTPATLIVAIIWLALLAPSTGRNVFTIVLIGIGYILYCTLAIFGVLRGKHGPSAAPGAEGEATTAAETIELHYFAAAILAVALTILLGVLYLSQH